MHRFAERSEEPIVGSLYVAKRAFPEGRPDALHVIIVPAKKG